MTAINRIVKALEQLRSEQDAIVIGILKDEGDLVADLNREQLLRGEDNTGKFITPKYRNPKYAARKQAQNSKPPFGTPDLKRTGKYHRALDEKYSGNTIKISNSDSKDKMLSTKYDNIKGLNDKSVAMLREEVLPELRDRFMQLI